MSKTAIGILGGSFNPPHLGHRALVQHALQRLSLGGMRLLVTPQNPLKDAGAYASLETRLAQTKDMMRGLPSVRVEPEAEIGPVFAAHSIRKIVTRNPGQPLVYVMGADSFSNLHQWYRWRELMHLLPIAIAGRPGFRMKALQSPAARAFSSARVQEARARSLPYRQAPAWCFLEGLARPESSTMIRRQENPSSRAS